MPLSLPHSLALPLVALVCAGAGPALLHAQSAALEGRVRVSEEIDGEPVQLEDHSNAVIFVSGFREPPEPGQEHELVQRDKQFSDRVLPVTRGETVSFPNLDGIHHNVWSRSKAKTFDLGLYKYPESREVTFENAGMVTVFCNIHAQMIATILVLPNSKYAVTGADGRFRIEGIDPGRWPVYAWVEGATPQKQVVTFEPGGTATLSFDLNLKRIPIRHLNKEGKPYEEY